MVPQKDLLSTLLIFLFANDEISRSAAIGCIDGLSWFLF